MKNSDEDPRRQTIATRDREGNYHTGGRQIRAVTIGDANEDRETRHRKLERAGEPGCIFDRRRS